MIHMALGVNVDFQLQDSSHIQTRYLLLQST